MLFLTITNKQTKSEQLLSKGDRIQIQSKSNRIQTARLTRQIYILQTEIAVLVILSEF